jgi:hypothetical protein
VFRRAAQLKCSEYQRGLPFVDPAPYLEEPQRTEAHSPLGLVYTVDKLSYNVVKGFKYIYIYIYIYVCVCVDRNVSQVWMRPC